MRGLRGFLASFINATRTPSPAHLLPNPHVAKGLGYNAAVSHALRFPLRPQTNAPRGHKCFTLQRLPADPRMSAGCLIPAGLRSLTRDAALTAGTSSAAAAVLAPAGRNRWQGWRFLAVSAVMTAGGAGTWVLAGPDPVIRLKLLWTVPVRLGRDIATGVLILADYKWSLRGLPPGSAAREEAKHACHLRCADRLQKLCFANQGIYIKLGQHIGQLDYLLPSEYVLAMRRVMLDKCPTSTYSQVCRIMVADLGKTPEEVSPGRVQLFASFDPQPLASASLAQVHKAVTHGGQTVAVKVQHAHLTDTAVADTATVRFIVNALHRLLPSQDYRWLLDQIEESLPKELDFEEEAKNACRCAENFATSASLRGHVVVPAVHPAFSGRRVLTMEFMEGVGVTDVEAIRRLGLDPAGIASLVSQAFAEMIFDHGFVHCDPHAANLMVRQHGGRPNLILLDHGLYRTLDPTLRRNYAELWKALVFADVASIQRYSVALGAGDDLYRLFAAVLTMRPWERIAEVSADHLRVPDTDEEKVQLQTYAAQYLVEVSELLRRLPGVLLLLLKTNDCLRAVDNALGAPANNIVIVARESSKALFKMNHPHPWGASMWLRSKAYMWRIQIRLLGLQGATWAALVFDKWRIWRRQWAEWAWI